jgi:thymidylate kinase
VERGIFVGVEGIDGAGKTTASRLAAKVLRSQGQQAMTAERTVAGWGLAYVTEHMAALRDLIWGEPPDAPYLDLPDDHWLYLQAAWYAALARRVIVTVVAAGGTVLVDTWGYTFPGEACTAPTCPGQLRCGLGTVSHSAPA